MTGRVEVVRDKKNNPYLFIRLTKKELFDLGENIQALKIIMESRGESLK